MKILVTLTRHALATGLLLTALSAIASTPVDGTLLGSSESELHARFETLVRMRKPLPGPNGLRGLWTLPDTRVAGLPFQTTFYLKDRRVTRIEQRWMSAQGACDDPSLIASVGTEMASKYGPNLRSWDTAESEATQQSMVWQTDEFDAMLYQSEAGDKCTLLIVYKPHLVKDASEL